jgi:hypothetical protein
VIAVPYMLWAGMRPDWDLVWWVVPLHDPPLYGFTASTLSLIWYLRQYLWFVLVSPLALPLFRRWPRLMLGAPFALMAAFQLGLPDIVPLKDFALYFACWMLGFAHHDGAFDRMPRRVTLPIGIGLGGLAAAWLFTPSERERVRPQRRRDVAQCLWSAGFVVLIFSYAPHSMAWLSRRRALSTVVRAVNERAVTIYLWHQTVIVGLGTLLAVTGISLSSRLDSAPWLLARVSRCRPLCPRRRLGRRSRRPAPAGAVAHVEEWASARTPARLP